MVYDASLLTIYYYRVILRHPLFAYHLFRTVVATADETVISRHWIKMLVMHVYMPGIIVRTLYYSGRYRLKVRKGVLEQVDKSLLRCSAGDICVDDGTSSIRCTRVIILSCNDDCNIALVAREYNEFFFKTFWNQSQSNPAHSSLLGQTEYGSSSSAS